MRFDAFVREETAAVTTDWVVLSAGIVGVGVAVMSSVSGGVENISFAIRDELVRTEVGAVYRYFGGTYEDYVRNVAWATRTTEEQVALFHTLVDPIVTTEAALQTEHSLWSGLAGDPSYPDPELAAERVALIEVAMDARGITPQPIG